MSAANCMLLLLLSFSLNVAAAAARTISIDECLNKWCEFDNAEITEIELSFQIANGDSYEVASDQSSFKNVTVTFYGSDKTKWHDSHEFHQRKHHVSNYVSYEVRPGKTENCEYKATMGECKSAQECEVKFGISSDLDKFSRSQDKKYFASITLGNSKLGTSSIGQIAKFKYVPFGSISSRDAPLNFDDAHSTFLENEKAYCLRMRGPPTPTSTTTTTTLPPSTSTTTASNPGVPSVISNPPPPGPSEDHSSSSAKPITTPSILESTSTNNPDLPPVISNPPGPRDDSSSSSTPSVLESTSSTTASNPDMPSVISNPPGPSEDSSSSSAKPLTVNPDDPNHPQTVTPGSNIPPQTAEPVTGNSDDPNVHSTSGNPSDGNESSSSNPNGPNDNNNNGSDPTCSDPNNCSSTPVSPDKKNDGKAQTAEAGNGFGLTDKNTWEADENGWTGPHANRNRALIFIFGNCVILAAFFITIFAMIMGGCLFNDTSSANSPQQQSVDYSEYGQLPSQQAQL